MSSLALQQLKALFEKLISQWKRSGGHITIKFHVAGEHLADQMSFAGNMTWTHNYADESCNHESKVRGDASLQTEKAGDPLFQRAVQVADVSTSPTVWPWPSEDFMIVDRICSKDFRCSSVPHLCVQGTTWSKTSY